MELLEITADDQHNIPVFYFKNKLKAIALGIIQILHGMSEHSQYYQDFINYFNNKGYDVFIFDQRGHGAAVTNNTQLGFIAKKSGAQKLISDTMLVTDLINQFVATKYPHHTPPLILFGHSMGSAIALSVIMECHKQNKDYYDLLLLTGTPGFVPNWQCSLGKLLVKFEIFRQYKDNIHAVSPISNFILNHGLNFAFRKEKKVFAWATRDNTWLDQISADPRAGFVPQNQFWLDLIDLFDNIKKPANIKSINTKLPILFLDGAADPVNNKTKQTLKLIKLLKQLGIENIIHKVYSQARHHLCIETNRESIFEELATLFNSNIKKTNSKITPTNIYENQIS